MPQRTRVELSDVAAWPNLCAAFWRAALGKRNRPEVRHFEKNLDSELKRLRRGILDLNVEVGRFRSFEIRDPKVRVIHAPIFRERVLHHALMAQIGPPLDRSLVPQTFACRAGKGTHAAVREAQKQIRRHHWYLHIDIRSYFASIHHETLKQVLARRIKGHGVLALCARILGAHQRAPGRGLPIGALTSQHFANLYLSSLDRLLAGHRDAAAMVRYMDDVVWWSPDRAAARRVLAEVEAHVEGALRLEIKPAWSLQRSGRGLAFCGFRILPAELRLSRRRRRRYAAARSRWERAHALGLVGDGELQAGYASALAITQGADATGWRREQLRRHPAPDV